MTKDELIQDIGRRYVGSEKINRKTWDGLASVISITSGSVGIHSFSYKGDDFSPTNPSDDELVDRLESLRDEMSLETGAAWHQALIQIWKPGPEINVTFEYDDPQRWKPKITGLDMRDYAMSIRPPALAER